MNYTVSEDRINLLQEHFFEFSFDGREPSREFFDSITNPVEYHLVVANYNWDDGTEVLDWIVDSPLCDKGTAMMIFWHAQPDYYTKFLSEEEATWGADVYNLLKKIINNWESGFYKTAIISYNPRKDPVAPGDIDYRDPNEKWPIPEYLKQPVEGDLEIILE